MNLLGWLPRLIAQPNPVQQKLAQLESQLATAQKRLQESITIAATPVSPLDRFVDGDRYLVPGGTRQDRQWGSNRPVLNQQWDLNQMRTNARLLLDANGFAIGGMDRLIDFVVGEGFKREITLRDAEPGATSDTEDPLIRQVTMLLDDWCKKYEWGHGEEDREAETFKRTSRDGEVFTRVDKDEESDSWMPWIRFVEPEHVYTPPDESQMSEWSWGILTKKGDVETRLAYWVGDPKAQTQAGDVVDAADIFHHKVNTDRTIKRGISDFFPVFDTFESARKILRNMGEVAAIQAAIAWIRQHAATTTADQVQRMIDRTKNYDQTNMRPVFPQGPDNTQPVTFTEPGQVLDMSNGMQYLAGPSATGSPGFIQVLQATLRGAGARWGAPEFFSGDASNNNFASILVSGSPFERYAKRRQSAFSAYQERIFYRVLEYAEKAGKVPPGTCGRIKIRCIPPAVAIANRNEDEQIRAQQNQAGVLSRTTWQRQVNLDPKIEAENFRREKEEGAQGQQQGQLSGMAGQDEGVQEGVVLESAYVRRTNRRSIIKVGESWYTRPALKWIAEGRSLSGLTKVKRTDRNGVSRYVYVRTGGDEGSTPKKAGQRSEAEHAAHVAELTATAQKIKSGKHTPEELKSFTEGLSKLTVVEIAGIKQQLGVKGGKLKAEHINRVVAFAKQANAAKATKPLNLSTYHAGDETEATSKQLFGHVPSSQDFARVGCAVNGGGVAVGSYVDEGSPVIVIMASYDGRGKSGKRKTGMHSSREIYRDRDGKLTCENYSFLNESDVTGVSGTELFRDQVETLRRLGVDHISTYGAGNKQLAAMDEGKSNGYYTWPRLGYSGEMPESQFAKLPPDIQTAMGDSRDVRTLFDSVPGGPEAWKEYGEGLSLTFDLAPGSVNMVALEKYLTKRGLR